MGGALANLGSVSSNMYVPLSPNWSNPELRARMKPRPSLGVTPKPENFKNYKKVGGGKKIFKSSYQCQCFVAVAVIRVMGAPSTEAISATKNPDPALADGQAWVLHVCSSYFKLQQKKTRIKVVPCPYIISPLFHTYVESGSPLHPG